MLNWSMEKLNDHIRNRNAPNSRKWYTMKTTVFGASSSLPPLIDKGGKLVWSAEEKASLFLAHVDAKQCRDRFQRRKLVTLHQYCILLPSWSSLICSLLLELDLHGRNDLDGMFSLFYKQAARELAPKLAVIFRHLVRGGNFPRC